MAAAKFKTREDWLTAAADYFRPRFAKAGKPLPKKIRMAIGFPSTGRNSKRVGECWSTEAAEDGAANIYVTPTWGAKQSEEILDTLAHELCHAALNNEGGHGKPFKQLATAIGLTGKMRSTVAGPELQREIRACIKAIGRIPHGALDAGAGPRKKQTTRLFKVECGDCGYVARVTRVWLEEAGAPLCPCNHEPMEIQA